LTARGDLQPLLCYKGFQAAARINMAIESQQRSVQLHEPARSSGMDQSELYTLKQKRADGPASMETLLQACIEPRPQQFAVHEVYIGQLWRLGALHGYVWIDDYLEFNQHHCNREARAFVAIIKSIGSREHNIAI
jgi:hypothetical protein